MTELVSHLIVQDTLRLPGLGLLVLPAAPEPLWLLQAALHTPFAITLPLSEHSSPIIGTVEEIAHIDQPPHRGLLLDFNPDILLPAGSYLEVGKGDNILY